MPNATTDQIKPGMRVAVTQQIAARNYTLPNTVEGTVLACEQRPTGSWYAHGRNDKLWLDRLTIRKSDGEISVLNLDEFSRVEIRADGD